MAEIKIDKEKCKGCEFCIVACPCNVIVIDKKLNKKGFKPAIVDNLEMCIGCSLCAHICPDVCIEIWK